MGNNLRQQHLSFGLMKERNQQKDHIEQVRTSFWRGGTSRRQFLA